MQNACFILLERLLIKPVFAVLIALAFIILASDIQTTAPSSSGQGYGIGAPVHSVYRPLLPPATTNDYLTPATNRAASAPSSSGQGYGPLVTALLEKSGGAENGGFRLPLCCVKTLESAWDPGSNPGGAMGTEAQNWTQAATGRRPGLRRSFCVGLRAFRRFL